MAAGHCIKIPGWPTCIDCVSWSADCEIVVACNETVEILIPKLKIDKPSIYDDEPEEDKWLRVRLRVSLFSAAELSFVRPLPFNAFSVGEEQSASGVIAVAWSQPGLAKNKRCALAVLTSNLVLSIWAYDSSPTLGSNWKRVLIINQHLEKSLKQSNSTSGLARLRCRIRAFTWSESLVDRPTSGAEEHSFDLFKGQDIHLIALSNDANEIVVCEITSPFTDPLNHQASWIARPLTYAGIKTFKSSVNSAEPSTNVGLASRTIADQLSWSPWFNHSGSTQDAFKSYIAFTLNSKLIIHECNLSLSEGLEINLSDDGDILPLSGKSTTSRRWVRDTRSNSAFLLTASPHTIICAAVPMSHTLEKNKGPIFTSQSTKTTWNDIAGIGCKMETDRTSFIVIPEQISFGEKKPCYISLPLNQTRPEKTPAWFEFARELNEEFSNDKNLPQEAVTRVWGLSSNACQDHIAICLSVHPRDMVHYATTSEQEFLLLVTREADSLPVFTSTTSAESMLFSVLRYLRNASSNNFLHQRKLNCLDESLRSLLSSRVLLEHPSIAMSTSNDAVWWLRRNIYNRRPLLGAVLNGLSTQRILHPVDSRDHPPVQYDALWALATTFIRISERGYEPSKLTLSILSNYIHAHNILVRNWPAHFLDIISDSTANYLSEIDFIEVCEICSASILFENVRWAICADGHQFLRCGISLLAIQDPRHSKYCELCGQRYFADLDFIRRDLNCSQPVYPTPFPSPCSASQPYSLTEVLQAACQDCISCGGKFRIL